MEGRVRRVVTGHDENGKAIVTSDGYAPAVRTNPLRPGHISTDIWKTDHAPARIGNEVDCRVGIAHHFDKPVTVGQAHLRFFTRPGYE